MQVEQGPNSLPTCFQRSEWLGEILAQGKDPSKLVKAAAQIDPTRPKPGWLLQYTRLETKLRRKTEYTAKTFLSCIAQAIPSPAALNPRDASTTLLILDIADDYVLLKLDSTKRQMEGALGCWLKRPFQYSSSINQNVAEIVIDIVLSLIPKPNDAIKLLDPTCGRGTFLAHALSRGLCYVEGWDINAACTEGSVRNLDFCFSDEVSHKWNLFRRDATAPCKTGQMRDFDCVVANLPWGENSIAYSKENECILQCLQQALGPGTPCAFVTKDNQSEEEMRRLGYNILGSAHVPQKDFELPRGKNASLDEFSRTSQRNKCVVTIALTSELS